MSSRAKVQVRWLGSSDLAQVCEIEQATQQFPWTLSQFSDALEAQYWLWGAFSQETNALVGFLVVMPVYDEVQILNIAVATSSQQEGVAHQLWQYLIQTLNHAEYQTIRSVLLEVAVNNVTAIEVYRHWGFEFIGQRKGYYRHGALSMDAQVMRYTRSTAPPQA